jgi:hypothetical protein
LGEFLEHIKKIDLYEKSIIIITADHGVSFHENEHRRSVKFVSNPAEIINVPLFIKLPHQSSGVISDRNVESIDIAPTVADLLGFTLPWPTDGVSVFEEKAPKRPRKRVFVFGWFLGKQKDNNRFPSELLFYESDQLSNIKKSVDYWNQYFLQDSEHVTFDTPWSNEARERAEKLIISGKSVTRGEVSIGGESLLFAKKFPNQFVISRIVGEVAGVISDAIVVLKLDENRRLEVVPIIDNKFSFFFNDTSYEEFTSKAELYILEKGELLKPEIKW